MIARRPLGDTLSAVADIADVLSTGAEQGFAVHSLEMELPLDLRIVHGADGAELIGDLPQFLTRTAFDPEPARLAIRFDAVPPEEAAP